MSDIYCKRSFHEDGDEFWSEGCWYELLTVTSHGPHIRNNFGGDSILVWEDYDDYFREKICHECGKPIDECDLVCVIDEGKDTEWLVCESCCATMCNNGNVIQCEACGAYFYAATLHDEEINGQSFTPCPVCGKDVVDCLTREEFMAEHRPYRYAVIVRDYHGGQRGYVVSVNGGQNEVIRKLADKVNLNGAAEITIAEILLEGDEFGEGEK